MKPLLIAAALIASPVLTNTAIADDSLAKLIQLSHKKGQNRNTVISSVKVDDKTFFIFIGYAGSKKTEVYKLSYFINWTLTKIR